ncbi:hypothetical protein MSG28_004290 [Choristoneura fumiferana]|uniref:Uncharacterized protein n=1 Tax=Choristoneura fumiferana TaxID=7141 RepID=A0ACC0KIV7_CHOFU|nr:hypothetical protein MSG28_004290 [Choristoneura fumiferana]
MSAASASSSEVNAENVHNRNIGIGDSDKNKTSSVKKKQDGNINSGTNTVIKVKSVIPRRRQDLLKWYGWGYKDSMFHLNDETASFTGDNFECYCPAGLPIPKIAKIFETGRPECSTKSYLPTRVGENARSASNRQYHRSDHSDLSACVSVSHCSSQTDGPISMRLLSRYAMFDKNRFS